MVGPPQEFYKAGLSYLAYTGVEDLSAAEASRLATDMALASVTGDAIFNFGEVLATPILGCLRGTQNEWLHDLVLALHRGSVEQFNAVVDRNREQYFAQAALANKHEDVKQKVVLLALLNMAFIRGSNDREISFADIAAVTYVPLEQVEWVLMRAMSVNLIKGSIDQVDQSVSVTWVQPRVLDKQQLEVISGQLGGWATRVKDTLVMVEDQTAELLC